MVMVDRNLICLFLFLLMHYIYIYEQSDKKIAHWLDSLTTSEDAVLCYIVTCVFLAVAVDVELYDYEHEMNDSTN